MASQIFNFPGFFDREIDLTSRQQAPTGIPAGVLGTSQRGPAFVPFTVGSFADYRSIFGDLNIRYSAPYAVDKFLENRTALTFIRVLGGGANDTSADISTTKTQGTVKNAGFAISGTLGEVTGDPIVSQGSVQFLVAKHFVSGNEAFGMPMFTNNDSTFVTGASDIVNLVRGVIFTASGTRVQVLSYASNYSETSDAMATPDATSRYFKLALSSSAGASFGTDEGFAGVRIYTASLNPTDDNYFAKLLNTDPEKFGDENHLLYSDFAVDAELATLETGAGSVAIASGSSNTSAVSGDTTLPFLNAFGRFDTRYTTPRSPWFISQPYGETEHDLFYIEATDDGAYANSKIKISISNIQKSANPKDKHGSFNLVIRAFDDTDTDPKVLEQFSDLSLDPASEKYIGKVIGDKKARFNFDAENADDRRLLTTGLYANRSRNIRVVISDAVALGSVPADAVPFGFRGVDLLNTNTLLLDTTGSAGLGTVGRLAIHGSNIVAAGRLEGAILPPIPLRFKVTRGNTDNVAGGLIGEPGVLEVPDTRYYWGVKFTRNSNNLNPNIVGLENKIIRSYTQFAGIQKLDVLVTGSGKDTFNNNKFTLARVALGNGALADITSSVNNHMKEAAYIRNGKPDGFEYKITDGAVGRVTLATLYQKGATPTDFNKFSGFAKFTTFLFGGFDGTNILDKNAALQNDRSTSTETRSGDGATGNASTTFVSPGFDVNQNGSGIQNATVNSYRVATDIITDTIASNVNILAVPGQRDPLVTDYTGDAVRDFGIAFYAMDIPSYDSNTDRIWDNETTKFIDVEQTANVFEQRALDNTAAGAYFPDVVMEDTINRRKVTVPSTVGALAALGFNDRVSYPWFAPAGFNRAALNFVDRAKVRIRQPERERLFAVHINPIVKFPGNTANVIFAQNTLEQAESALGSINVVRMMNELKRQVADIGNRVIWEQITPEIYTELGKSFRGVLNTITSRAGIERYDVIVDDRNNTSVDRDNNTVNVRIVLIPTRTVEFIAIDFIITRSGVSFSS